MTVKKDNTAIFFVESCGKLICLICQNTVAILPTSCTWLLVNSTHDSYLNWPLVTSPDLGNRPRRSHSSSTVIVIPRFTCKETHPNVFYNIQSRIAFLSDEIFEVKIMWRTFSSTSWRHHENILICNARLHCNCARTQSIPSFTLRPHKYTYHIPMAYAQCTFHRIAIL